jgi:hypothetical protein
VPARVQLLRQIGHTAIDKDFSTKDKRGIIMKRKPQFLLTAIKIFPVFFGFFLLACNGTDSNHIVTIKKGTTKIKGNINGTVLMIQSFTMIWMII